jgi:hypothetical protein
MEKIATTRSYLLARMQSATWQDQLRASVHLYLALGASPSLAQEMDELLQRTEEDLLDYLLAGDPPTAPERARAQHLLDLAQHALLDSELQQSQLRGTETEYIFKHVCPN